MRQHAMIAAASAAALSMAAAAAPQPLEFGRKDGGAGGGDGGGGDDLATLAKSLKAATEQVKQLGEDIKAKYEKGQEVSRELKETADQALSEMNALKARLDEVEQKAARTGEPALQDLAGSWGEQFCANLDEIKEYAGRRGKAGKLTFEVKTISGLTSGAGGALLRTQYVDGIVATPERRMTVRDLLAPGRTDQQSITYFRETGFTNNADVVSETTQKPESSITFEDITETVKTIAHWVPASKQILADVPMLQSYIDQRLRYGLRFKEEGQLLNGSGTGNNIEGLNVAATAYSAPFVLSGATMIDVLRLAMLQAALAEYPANGHILNPIDWTRIELTKDGEGRYIIGNPQSQGQATLWGLPVVPTQSQTVDKFTVGAFDLAAQIFDREDASVQISDEDGDNFKKNMVTILAEERLALAIYRPEAIIYGDFGNV